MRSLPDLGSVITIPAHEGEAIELCTINCAEHLWVQVMKLCYTSQPISSKDCLLASAGRDRLIHLLEPHVLLRQQASLEPL